MKNKKEIEYITKAQQDAIEQRANDFLVDSGDCGFRNGAKHVIDIIYIPEIKTRDNEINKLKTLINSHYGGGFTDADIACASLQHKLDDAEKLLKEVSFDKGVGVDLLNDVDKFLSRLK